MAQAQALQVSKFNGPMVKWREYNGKVEPSSTVASMWPSAGKPGACGGKTLSGMEFADYGWAKDTKLGLLPAPTADGSAPTTFVLTVGGNPIAHLESRSYQGGTYLTGCPGFDQEVGATRFSADVRFFAWPPHPQSAALKKGATWTLKVVGKARDKALEDGVEEQQPVAATPQPAAQEENIPF